MSRTDKDRPSWVRNRDPLEEGFHEQHNHASHKRWGLDGTGECDIEIAREFKGGWRREVQTFGRYLNCDTSRGHWTFNHYVSVNPPKEWVDAHDNNRSRTATRSRLRELVKQYHGDGDIDEDEFARHSLDRRLRLPYWD